MAPYPSRTQSNVDALGGGSSVHGIASNGSSQRLSKLLHRTVSLSGNAPMDSHSNVSSALRNPSFSSNLSRTNSDADNMREVASTAGMDESFAMEEQTRELLTQALSITKNEQLKRILFEILDSGGMPACAAIPTSMSTSPQQYFQSISDVSGKGGYLWKKGKFLHVWSKRYCLISGNCIYYYNTKNDSRPKGVIFLTGSLVEKIHDRDLALKGYFGFELLHQDMCTGEHHK